ncbi:hypothetical protein [Rhodococcus daqingensis]|uniref:Uncharacterized protein n=1 Tax=Rhodococcus daqingensis TaxID=2479363 RepID=A0ABW2RVC3_9NOCA
MRDDDGKAWEGARDIVALVTLDALDEKIRIDGLGDTIESILATHLAMQGDSLTEIMKKLTAVAAIIAIPTG